MADARRIHDWNQTAGLMAIIANIIRPANRKPFEPADFAPFLTRHKPAPPPMGSIEALKVFLKP